MRRHERLAPAILAMILSGCAGAPKIPVQPAVATYECESGALIQASYLDTDHARIAYQGRTRTLTIAVSASGARYVGEGVEWWTKGSGPGSSGSLFAYQSDGASGELIETCKAR